MLKTYNGFEHHQRMRALGWLKKEYAAGRRTRPVRCDACGQTEGHIEAHSEDYSSPFGDHIGQHGLCYRCHMMIHCRFRNPEAWDVYKKQLRQGWRFAPLPGRSFYIFTAQTLTRMGEGVPHTKHQPRGRTLLDDLR